MSVTNLRRLISVEYLSVYIHIRSGQHESAPVAFIARTAVDSDRLQGVTMYGQVVDRRRSPETKIFSVRNDPQLRIPRASYFYFSPPTALPLHPRSRLSREFIRSPK